MPWSGGKNQKWHTSGPGGYVTPAASGVPNVSKRGTEAQVVHKWAKWLHNRCRLGVPNAPERGKEWERTHKWDGWLQ